MSDYPVYLVRDLSLPSSDHRDPVQRTFELPVGASLAVRGGDPNSPGELLRLLTRARIECPESMGLLEHLVAYSGHDPQLDPELDVMGNLNQALASVRATNARIAQLFERSSAPSAFENSSASSDQHEEELDGLLHWTEKREVTDLKGLLQRVAKGLDLPLPSAAVSELDLFERRRLGLAMLLLQQPDIALLELSTDCLSREAGAWLAQYLQSFPGTLLLACKDESFLQQATSWNLEIGDAIESKQKPAIAGSARRRSGKPVCHYLVVASPIDRDGPTPQFTTVDTEGEFVVFLPSDGLVRVEVFEPRESAELGVVGWWLQVNPLASQKPVSTGTYDLSFLLP